MKYKTKNPHLEPTVVLDGLLDCLGVDMTLGDVMADPPKDGGKFKAALGCAGVRLVKRGRWFYQERLEE